MNFKTLVWKNRHSRVWFLVSAITLVVIFTITMIATQSGDLRRTIYLGIGGPTARIDGGLGLYDREFLTKEDVLVAANALNVEIAEEGFVLLRNENNSLPLSRGNNVSVFGRNSVDLLHGGSGSGAKGMDAPLKTIFDSLDAAGFNYNSSLRSFYENSASGAGGPGRAESPGFGSIIAGFGTGETPIGNLTGNAAVVSSYANYNHAALVVITRIGGEGFDLPRTMATQFEAIPTLSATRQLTPEDGRVSTAADRRIPGARSSEDHYLQLDANEVGLLLHVTEHFENVVLVLNTNNNLELGFLDRADYWRDVFGITDNAAITRAMSRINSAILIGSPGGEGIMALGRILNGDVNPSGRTVSTHARDFWAEPALQNFGNNNRLFGDAHLTPFSATSVNDYRFPAPALRTFFVDYEEGIYVGYRYWETRAADPAPGDAVTWYDDHVVFPFGWGLSFGYRFTWDNFVTRLVAPDGTEISLPSVLSAQHYAYTIEVDVRVTNPVNNPFTRPSRDVVQLYINAPFYRNGTTAGIEKAHVALMDFAKTDALAPGASQILTLSFNMYDIASYDFNDANGNGFIGWETEAGEYTIYLMSHSNAWQNDRGQNVWSTEFEVPQLNDNATNGSTGFTFRYDPHTPGSAAIVNRFDDVSFGMGGTRENPTITYLSRADWIGTFPTPPTIERRRLESHQRAGALFGDWAPSAGRVMEFHDLPGRPWYTTVMPTQAASPVDPDAEDTILLIDMREVPHGDDKWQTFLNQLTVQQMIELVAIGAFGTQHIGSIGKPITTHADGPVGWTQFTAIFREVIHDTAFYVAKSTLGATFSRRLAREFGTMIGHEGLIGNVRGDGLPYSGWYAPGVNIHRTPFSGRNWEYFGEDPVHSGRMAAQVVAAARERGLITYAKHFALNDQETNRAARGLFTWASEQAMREIYFRPFEILVKEGGSLGIMSSYNRIGTTWTGGDYRLLTEILRNEWGFVGVVISDYADHASYMWTDQKIRAGGDLNLESRLLTISHDAAARASSTHVSSLRRASHNILYAVANSSGMDVVILGMRRAWWVTGLMWLNIGLLVGFLAWGFFALNVKGIIKGTHKLSKQKAGVGIDAFDASVEATANAEGTASVNAAESSLEDGGASDKVDTLSDETAATIDEPAGEVIEKPAAAELVQDKNTTSAEIEGTPAPKKSAAKKKPLAKK